MTAKTDGKTKTCSRCAKRKKLSEFGSNSSHKDGLQSDCNVCRKARETGYRAAKTPAKVAAKLPRDVRLGALPAKGRRAGHSIADLARPPLPTTNIPVKTKQTARKVAS